MRILLRHAENDFEALLIANAMEKAGAKIFNITSNGERKSLFAAEPHTRFIVWAKCDERFSTSEMDRIIEEHYDKRTK